MGNKSCYSNTRRNTTSNLIGLTNTSQHVPELTPYHIFHDKSLAQHECSYKVPPVDLFLAPYYNIEILTDNLDNEQECGICFELFCQKEQETNICISNSNSKENKSKMHAICFISRSSTKCNEPND